MSGSDCDDFNHCECANDLYKRIAELEAEVERLRKTLEEIVALGQDGWHGRGYSLAKMAKEALLSLDGENVNSS